MAACLNKLKNDIRILESLFPKNHPRFQIINISVDEISCRFIGQDGEKINISGNIMVGCIWCFRFSASALSPALANFPFYMLHYFDYLGELPKRTTGVVFWERKSGRGERAGRSVRYIWSWQLYPESDSYAYCPSMPALYARSTKPRISETEARPRSRWGQSYRACSQSDTLVLPKNQLI